MYTCTPCKKLEVIGIKSGVILVKGHECTHIHTLFFCKKLEVTPSVSFQESWTKIVGKIIKIFDTK